MSNQNMTNLNSAPPEAKLEAKDKTQLVKGYEAKEGYRPSPSQEGFYALNQEQGYNHALPGMRMSLHKSTDHRPNITPLQYHDYQAAQRNDEESLCIEHTDRKQPQVYHLGSLYAEKELSPRSSQQIPARNSPVGSWVNNSESAKEMSESQHSSDITIQLESRIPRSEKLEGQPEIKGAEPRTSKQNLNRPEKHIENLAHLRKGGESANLLHLNMNPSVPASEGYKLDSNSELLYQSRMMKHLPLHSNKVVFQGHPAHTFMHQYTGYHKEMGFENQQQMESSLVAQRSHEGTLNDEHYMREYDNDNGSTDQGGEQEAVGHQNDYDLSKIEKFEQIESQNQGSQEAKNSQQSSKSMVSGNSSLSSPIMQKLMSPNRKQGMNMQPQMVHQNFKMHQVNIMPMMRQSEIEDEMGLLEKRDNNVILPKEEVYSENNHQAYPEFSPSKEENANEEECNPSVQNFLNTKFKLSIDALIYNISTQSKKSIISQLSQSHLTELEGLANQFYQDKQYWEYEALIDEVIYIINQIKKQATPSNGGEEVVELTEQEQEEKQANIYEREQNMHPDDPMETQNISLDWTPEDKFRAKLYQLDNEGAWHDLGTGYFSIEHRDDDQYQMLLFQEQGNHIDLLENEVIESSMKFHRQRETIITWSFKDRQRDLAVSFQNNQGAFYTWQKICQIRGVDPDHNSQDSQAQDEDDAFTQVSFETIPKMAEELRQVASLDTQVKNEIAHHFLDNDASNILKLGQLFDECEQDTHSKRADRNEYLFYFHCIYKGLISMNDQMLLEVLLSSRFYLQTFGALEWDPEALIDDRGDDGDAVLLNSKSPEKETDSPTEKKSELEANEENKENISPTQDEANQVDQTENQAFVEKKSQLNYREFLSKIVKYKKVVNLDTFSPISEQEQEQQSQGENNGESETQGTQGAAKGQSGEKVDSIEERIHINYRLQFLKDTVMARYIDDQTVTVINQLIMQNNKAIVYHIFDAEDITETMGLTSSKSKTNFERGESLKDQIITKISSKTDMKSKHLAIEFMIELCQILKSLQFSTGGLGNSGGASSFMYCQGGVNSRNMYEQLNQINFVGVLVETFAIFIPNEQTLQAHIHRKQEGGEEEIQKLYKSLEQEMDEQVISDLLQFKKDRNNTEGEEELCYDQTTRLDQMKINSMEIIISFQQSIHVPQASIINFLLMGEQNSKGFPFLNQLVQHLIYSYEQGLKIQICDFFKNLFEDQSNSNFVIKETMYREIIAKFVQFLNQYTSAQASEEHPDKEKRQNLEYSIYLIMQILNKVMAEHKYPFRTCVVSNMIIERVAKLVNLGSKLINIEIVKFYKAIIKSKDHQYVQLIIKNNLFYPVMQIFEANYDQKNPPMIQSCIRDLFELILSNEKNNEYFQAKLMQYLTNEDQKSSDVIFNAKYKEVFQKYVKQVTAIKEDEDNYLNNKELDDSIIQSRMSGALNSDDLNHWVESGEKKDDNFEFKKGSRILQFPNDRNNFILWGGDEAGDDQFFEQDQNDNEERHKGGDNYNHGNLSPIIDQGNSYLLEDDFDEKGERNAKSDPKKKEQNESQINKWHLEQQTDFLLELEKEIEEDMKKKKLEEFNEFGEKDIEIRLEADNDKKVIEFNLSVEGSESDKEDTIHNNAIYKQIVQNDKKSDELKHQQKVFELKLRQKREESSANSTGKLVNFTKGKHNHLEISTEKLSQFIPIKEKHIGYTKAHSQHEMPFERLSSSSSELQAILGEDDLAKDAGIFNLQKSINKGNVFGGRGRISTFSPTNGAHRRSSFDELDLENKEQPQNQFAQIKNQRRQTVVHNSSSCLKGIFSGSHKVSLQPHGFQITSKGKRTLSGERLIVDSNRTEKQSSTGTEKLKVLGTSSPVPIESPIIDLHVKAKSLSSKKEELAKLSPGKNIQNSSFVSQEKTPDANSNLQESLDSAPNHSLQKVIKVGEKRYIDSETGMIQGNEPAGSTPEKGAPAGEAAEEIEKPVLKQQKTTDS